jgi:hypothetical protein
LPQAAGQSADSDPTAEAIQTISFNVNVFVYDNRRILDYMLLSSFAIGFEIVAYFALFFVVPRSFFTLYVTFGFIAMLIAAVYTLYYFSFAMVLNFREILLDGGKPHILKGLSEARQYSKLIFEWAIFEGVFIYLLSRIGFSGKFIFSELAAIAAGITLGVSSFFVTPIIIDKKTGPIKSTVLSSQLMYKNSIISAMLNLALGKTRLKRTIKAKALTNTAVFKILLIAMVIGAVIFMYGVIGFTIFLEFSAVYYVILGASIVGIIYLTLMQGEVNLYKMVMYDYFSGKRQFKKMYAPIPSAFMQS